MVRLLLLLATASHSPCFGFNPTMVRLLRLGRCWRLWLTTGFNPTMVRLLLQLHLNNQIKNMVVSIPQWCDCCTRLARNFRLKLKSFNPTMVRLLPRIYFPTSPANFSFNPTMVRLLQQALSATRMGDACFNPTMVRLLPAVSLIAGGPHFCFNPTMVRLLHNE